MAQTITVDRLKVSGMIRITVALIASLISIAMPAVAADATDIVIFDNGDRLTGEVKSLERGRLRFKTDATDTISIEWDNVAFLKSDQNLQVETEEGTRYLGRLSATSEENRIVVETSSGPVDLDRAQVILMAPIEERGMDRFDGDVSAGFNFTKAEEIMTTNVSVDLNYRTESRIFSVDFDSLVTDDREDDEASDDDAKPSQDLGLFLTYNRLLANRWVAGGILNFERNDELGLDLRSTIGAGGGRYLQQTNNSVVVLTGGLQVSREERTERVGIALQEEDVVIDDFFEAFVKLKWDWFRYDTPELDLTTSLQLIPNLTDSGEYRGEFEVEFKWEIVEDLFWSLSFTDSYDSKVAEDEGEKND